MHEQALRALLRKQKDNIDISRIDELVNHLLLIPEEHIHNGISKTKESLATLLFGLFFGMLGVDMFYIGETRRGLRKLIMTILLSVFDLAGFILIMIVVADNPGGQISANMMPLFIISLVLFGLALIYALFITIFWIMDMTEAYKLTQKANAEMLLKL